MILKLFKGYFFKSTSQKEKGRLEITWCWQHDQVIKSIMIYGKHDQHGCSSNPTNAILLCSWEKNFIALSSAWQS